MFCKGRPQGARQRSKLRFDSVGFALEDYSALRCMHALARSAGLLAQIELIPTLDDPKDLFAMVRQAQATHTALNADRKAA